LTTETCDVAIIGAGPAGSVASAMLANKGWDVKVLERQHFPRFSIGESLLPQCMAFIAEAGLMDAIQEHEFQFKDGAAFESSGEYTDIYFPNKSSPGPGTALQVARADFDKLLIDGAEKLGVKVSYGDTVTAFEDTGFAARLTVKDESGSERHIDSKFVLDGSGFGRVLPRLLDLSEPSAQDKRRSVYAHVKDNIKGDAFDRNKIAIIVHPNDDKVWIWLIPQAGGIMSIGVVGADETIEATGNTPQERLDYWMNSSGWAADILKDAEPHREAGELVGFASSVKHMSSDRYALLGNAGEFLDPVFSSGVTMAMKSAQLAANCLDRQLNGETVDWDTDFTGELKVGTEAFRACVDAWYTGQLPKIIFSGMKGENDVTEHITAVLAGYAWDRNNPIVRQPVRFLNLVERACAA